MELHSSNGDPFSFYIPHLILPLIIFLLGCLYIILASWLGSVISAEWREIIKTAEWLVISAEWREIIKTAEWLVISFVFVAVLKADHLLQVDNTQKLFWSYLRKWFGKQAVSGYFRGSKSTNFQLLLVSKALFLSSRDFINGVFDCARWCLQNISHSRPRGIRLARVWSIIKRSYYRSKKILFKTELALETPLTPPNSFCRFFLLTHARCSRVVNIQIFKDLFFLLDLFTEKCHAYLPLSQKSLSLRDKIVGLSPHYIVSVGSSIIVTVFYILLLLRKYSMLIKKQTWCSCTKLYIHFKLEELTSSLLFWGWMSSGCIISIMYPITTIPSEPRGKPVNVFAGRNLPVLPLLLDFLLVLGVVSKVSLPTKPYGSPIPASVKLPTLAMKSVARFVGRRACTRFLFPYSHNTLNNGSVLYLFRDSLASRWEYIWLVNEEEHPLFVLFGYSVSHRTQFNLQLLFSVCNFLLFSICNILHTNILNHQLSFCCKGMKCNFFFFIALRLESSCSSTVEKKGSNGATCCLPWKEIFTVATSRRLIFTSSVVMWLTSSSGKNKLTFLNYYSKLKLVVTIANFEKITLLDRKPAVFLASAFRRKWQDSNFAGTSHLLVNKYPNDVHIFGEPTSIHGTIRPLTDPLICPKLPKRCKLQFNTKIILLHLILEVVGDRVPQAGKLKMMKGLTDKPLLADSSIMKNYYINVQNSFTVILPHNTSLCVKIGRFFTNTVVVALFCSSFYLYNLVTLVSSSFFGSYYSHYDYFLAAEFPGVETPQSQC